MHEASKLVKQEELLNLLLMHIPLKECAARLHVSYVTIRKYASEVEFLNNLRLLSGSIYTELIEELKFERKSMQQRMTEASDKALTRLEALLSSAQEGIALKAADSILDRTSETARNRKIEGDMTNRFTFDPLTLMSAARTAEELGQAYERDTSKVPRSEPERGADPVE
jgi:hypothetical protein